MADIGAQARIANASTRKHLALLLGRSDSNQPKEINNGEADFFRQERQEMNSAWQEASDETAGVGATTTSPISQQDSKAVKLAAFAYGNSKDNDTLRRRMLGSKANVYSNNRKHAPGGIGEPVLGKRNHGLLTSRGRNGQFDESDDEDEEEGRTALGSSRIESRQKRPSKAAKQKVQVETFESMQQALEDVVDNDENNETDMDIRNEDPNHIKEPESFTRPKNYLDELLEAKKNKRKKRKAAKKGGLNGNS